METFVLIRVGLPNTATVAAMALLPILMIFGGALSSSDGTASKPAVVKMVAAPDAAAWATLAE